MKKALAITALLVILVIGGIFAALTVPAETEGLDFSAVSDKVTAPDPHGLSAEQQQRGIEALQEFINQNK